MKREVRREQGVTSVGDAGREVERLAVCERVHLAVFRDGLGIADLPDYLVEEDLRVKRLSRVLSQLETPPRSVYGIYAAGPLLPTRVRDVAGFLERELKKALA